MKAIVSSRYGVNVIDLTSGAIVCTVLRNTEHSMPYGITWDDESNMYITMRHMCCTQQSVVALDHRLQYNKHKSFNKIPQFTDLHQILYNHSTRMMYVTSPGINAIECIIKDTHSWLRWYPVPEHKNSDVHHWNSVWVDEDYDELCIVAHKKSYSSLYVYNLREVGQQDGYLQPYRVYDGVGYGSHNVVRLGDWYVICDSSNGGRFVLCNRITSSVKYFQVGEVGQFIRGVAYNPDNSIFAVGLSHHIPDKELRDEEWKSQVLVFDAQIVSAGDAPDFKQLKSVGVNKGQIYDVRFLDVLDVAHNEIIWEGVHGATV